MPDITSLLVDLIIDELSAGHQYRAEESWLRNIGYTRLADIVGKRVDQEYEHADELLARLYELGGTPDMTMVREVNVGTSATSILDNDDSAEVRAIGKYNAGIALAAAAGDFTTRKLLEHIVEEEARHLKEIREFLQQEIQMGEQNFLASLVGC